MVPKDVYDKKLALFEKTIHEDKLFGKRFRTTRGNNLFSGHEVTVKEFNALEPDFSIESYWLTILVTEIEP